MYRLLALDLDGTLLTPQHIITPRTSALLHKVVEAGITLVIAMGNAHDEVKNIANHVTRSNSEEGVAVALEELVLPAL